MAGETIKTYATCLRIVPWSRSSHVVNWLTPNGTITTVVKGAVRSKSFFLGQYDLNYTCEIIYYARAKNNLHALRECTIINARETIRKNFRALALADYARHQTLTLSPNGPEAAEWFNFLNKYLSSLSETPASSSIAYLKKLIFFELNVLRASGLEPDAEAEKGVFHLRGERKIPISEKIAHCLKNPEDENDPEIIRETIRALGIFYSFHLDAPNDSRRILLALIAK